MTGQRPDTWPSDYSDPVTWDRPHVFRYGVCDCGAVQPRVGTVQAE